jgi:nucleosome binding factor SPN SPT16 subunit
MGNFNVWNETFSQIHQEFSNLHRLIDSSRSLFEKVRIQEPDHTELLALASVLHSFYMGFENIFKRIAQQIDGKFEKTDSWHVDLLESMIETTGKRPAILTPDVKRRLRFYLGFRHVFRSHYSYDLNWSKMKPLVLKTEDILSSVENEIQEFIKRYS